MVAGSAARATAGWDLHEVRDADACGAAGFGAGSAAGLGPGVPRRPGPERERFARSLGFADASEFDRHLGAARRHVATLFD